MTDFTDTSYVLRELQERLGLGDWTIRYAPTWLEGDDNEDANVRFRPDERVAVIRIHPRVPEALRPRLIAHELVHVLLKDLTYLACSQVMKAGKSGIPVVDMLVDQEERICNALATALTGQRWQPVTKKERVWYTPFAEAA